MKIIIELKSNGIHATTKMSVEAYDVLYSELIAHLGRIVDDFNDNAIKEA